MFGECTHPGLICVALSGAGRGGTMVNRQRGQKSAKVPRGPGGGTLRLKIVVEAILEHVFFLLQMTEELISMYENIQLNNNFSPS